MAANTLDELLAIVKRDLEADDVRFVEDTAPPAAPPAIEHEVPGGRRLVVTFSAPPADAEARARRLAMLISAFRDVLVADGRARAARQAPARSLSEELAALVQRASAVEAVVIDAFSPVIWGSAGELSDPASRVAEVTRDMRAGLHEVRTDDLAAAAEYGMVSAQGLRVDPAAMRLVPRAVCARRRLVPVGRSGDRLVIAMADPRDADAIFDVMLVTGLDVEPVFAGESMASFLRHLDDEDGDHHAYDEVMAAIPAEDRAAREPLARRAKETFARAVLARRAIAAVRALPDIEDLNKGGQLRETMATADFGYVARSFSAIYIVILVFERPFDELLAKRALSHAMPTIERLVAALPPMDPPPNTVGVAVMRMPRRRRR
jgi:hypothetical protein